RQIIVDITAPNAPIISSVMDDVGTVIGDIANGGRTNDTTPTLNGTAEAGSVVRIYNGTTLLGSVVATIGGNWTYTTSALTSGMTYNFKVTATDVAGNVSADSATRQITVDTTPPNSPVISSVVDNVGTVTGDIANGGRTNDTTPTLNGTAEAGSVVRIYNGVNLLGSVVATNGSWTYTTTALTDGTTYNFRATATDVAGNVSADSATRQIIVDTTAPNAPVISSVVDNVGGATGNIANGGDTDDSTPTLNGTAETGSIVRITVDNGTIYSVTATGGNWTWTPPAGLALGNHTFSVTATDAAGNTSGATTRSVNIVSPVTSGFEDFNTFTAGTEFASGVTHTLASGLKFRIGTPYDGVSPNRGAVVPTPSGGNAQLSPTGDMSLIFDGMTAVSLELSGVNDSFQTSNTKTTYTVYDTLGQLITSGIPADGLSTYIAPAGRLIGRIDFALGSFIGGSPVGVYHDIFLIDNVRWTAPSGTTAFSTDSVGDESADTSGVEHLAAQDEASTPNVEVQEQEGKGDILLLNGADQVLDLSAVSDQVKSIETVDITGNGDNTLNLSLNDVLHFGEKDLFINDGKVQMMVKGDEGDVVNLEAELEGTDPTDWAKAAEAVEVAGVRYEVYQNSAMNVELLVQEGVTTNLH
ncbi:Ig-like domain-containing protein, partial [Pseudomonas sp.]|uniref:Ig-like domain-containing protein n=1 Tax=Pseudomonas sp. TaxID=306 RepID=UPI003D6EA772